MNHYQGTGVIMSITLPNEAEAKKGRAGLMVLRYGGRRDSKGNSSRQYVNAVPMRIPSRHVKNFRSYAPGDFVEVMGRMEGIVERSVAGGQMHSAQLVATIINRVDVKSFGWTTVPTKENDSRPPVGSEAAAPQAEAEAEHVEEEEAHDEAVEA